MQNWDLKITTREQRTLYEALRLYREQMHEIARSFQNENPLRAPFLIQANEARALMTRLENVGEGVES